MSYQHYYPGAMGYDDSLAAFGTETIDSEDLAFLRTQCHTYEEELKRVTSRVGDLKRTVSDLTDKLIKAQTERDVYRLKLHRAVEVSADKRPATAPNTVGVAGSATPLNDRGTSWTFSNERSNEEEGGDFTVAAEEESILEENRKTIMSLHSKVQKKRKDVRDMRMLVEAYMNKFGPLNQLNSPNSEGPGITVFSPKRKKKRSPIFPAETPNDKTTTSPYSSPHASPYVKPSFSLEAPNVTFHETDEEEGDTTLEQLEEEEEEDTTDEDMSDSDDDVKALNALAALKDKEYQHNIQKMSQIHDNLGTDINDKEDIMRELAKTREHAKFMRKQYENKIKEMEVNYN